jgi:hypothetical protein
MNVLKVEKKTFEHIRKILYKISKDILHMNDTYIDTYNLILETLHQTAAHMPQSPV